VKIS